MSPFHLPRLLILTTVLIEAVAIGIIFPIMPDLMKEVLGTGLADAALWGGVLISAFALMQFLFGPIVGNLSDAHGRRPVLLISLVVIVGDYVVMALASSIWVLLIGRIVGGIAAATLATASAYMADISSQEERSANFGLVSAAFGAGFVLGPIIGGFLGELGTRAPFWVAAGVGAVNLALALAFLPESLAAPLRRPFRLVRANPFSALATAFRLPALRMLLVVMLIFMMSMTVYAAIWSYFAKARFGWDAGLIGISLTIYGSALMLVQAVLFRPISRRLGDRGTVLFGLVGNALSFLLLAFIRNGPATLVLTPVTALGEVAGPALTGIASKATPMDAQGELQGVFASLQAVSMIVSPLALGAIFRAFTNDGTPVYWPGAPFMASALMLVPCVAIFLLSRPPSSA
ncbi:MFS transporter [Pseudooceanicola sp. HF7]|uniref:MFS transporter n=1 Tax=Pseudooceanicola sp. HF7 TaxID=2721560 RepID=UPI0014321D42|nr:MFS transporter [Pseudooceanicola sp. HF7]NIZ10208.1 TCR/Tet family MFS transporter [Pseudooceanicola sp. HF7]